MAMVSDNFIGFSLNKMFTNSYLSGIESGALSSDAVKSLAGGAKGTGP